jgi:hypothetical protein
MKTENFTESLKNIADLQKEAMKNFFTFTTNSTNNLFANPFEGMPNQSEIYENAVKFHTACIQYHNSILSMLEAMNALNPVKTNKK